MYCSQCGEPLPEDARFCPACGTPVREHRSAGAPEDTTAAIDVGAFDQYEALEGLPELEPGTGMLVVVRGPNAGSRYLLDRGLTTIGRHPDSHLFLDDVTVSRRHAEVEADEGEMVIRDLGSLNGTYVNGERTDERPLGTGDEVQIGRFKLVYVAAESGA